MSDFAKAFVALMANEGGLSDVSSDPGNWTGGQIGAGSLIGTHWGLSAPVLVRHGVTTAEGVAAVRADHKARGDPCGRSLPVSSARRASISWWYSTSPATHPAHRLGSEGIRDGDVLTAAGCELRVVATPGHSADSVSLLLSADGALLTGDTVVTVPATADVTFDCKNTAGSVTCLSHSGDGVGQAPITGTDFGDDGPGGQKITLHVSNGVGNVEVRRG